MESQELIELRNRVALLESELIILNSKHSLLDNKIQTLEWMSKYKSLELRMDLIEVSLDEALKTIRELGNQITSHEIQAIINSYLP